MEHRTYSTLELENANIAVFDRPLVVNCTGIVSLQQDFSSGMSAGRNDYYLMYLCRGEMEIHHGDKFSRFKRGQFLIYPPGTPYHYRNTPGSHVDYYWVHFTGYEAEDLLKKLEIPQNTPVDIGIQDAILRAFHRLFDEYIQPDELFEASCGALLTTLCVRFARAARGMLTGSEKQWMLTEALQYMNRHYAEELTVSRLAEQANVSLGYFRCLFREATGTTPTEYLTRLRLKNACLLLQQTDIPIKEIAVQVGFSDQLYFSRVFRKKYGMPPSAFRASDAALANEMQ